MRVDEICETDMMLISYRMSVYHVLRNMALIGDSSFGHYAGRTDGDLTEPLATSP